MNRRNILNKTKTFTEHLRTIFKSTLDPIATLINRTGLRPNTITLLGLLGNVFAAVLLAQGQMLWGGLLVLLMAPVDALDGSMARLRGETSQFGAFVDSVTDRYSELVTFAGLLYYYVQNGDAAGTLLVYFAAAGSVLVSYTKARADSLAFDANTGILTRAERYFVLVPGLLFNLVIPALWILAIFANITALQRILRVRKQHYANLKNQ
jgi:CDP-diacylglycerol---glycerol-3-phosphate 3-phosphatidyltransferase